MPTPSLWSINFPSSGLRIALGDGLGQHRLEGARVGADEFVSLLAVLEDHECGHGADAELLADVRELIDVDLDEVDLAELRPVRKPVCARPVVSICPVLRRGESAGSLLVEQR